MSLKKAIFNSTIFKGICSAIGLLSFSALSFFVAVFLTALAYFWSNDQATVFDTAYSPDGKLKAVVFKETQNSKNKNVSVLGVKSNLEKGRAGNVFSESCNFVSAKWLDNQRLVIYRDGDGRADGKPESFIAFDRGIEIEFRDMKGE